MPNPHRQEFTRHLFRYHGSFTIPKYSNLTIEHLEKIHSAFHLDEHMCPSHEHPEDEVTEVKLILGDKYVEELVKLVQGDDV